MKDSVGSSQANSSGFVRGLGLWDATMVVAGSMIGSGVFIVSADIARQVGSAGWLLVVWIASGLLTVAAALAYGELAAMMPEAGGQYVFLREAYSPFWGFLYGWALFLVIQTGTIAAVAVAFSRFLGVLVPAISPANWIVPPIDLSASYAVSLSTQQFVGILMLIVLTWTNTRGLALARWIQNVFTSTKTLAVFGLIVVGLIAGANSGAIRANFAAAWVPHGVAAITPDLGFVPSVTAASGLFGLVVAFCVAQVGSLFSSDAWNNITFAAGEVRDPRRTLAIAMAAGTGLVVTLYVLANVAYVVTLPIAAIQHAPDDRVATAALQTIFGGAGASIMAVAIVISTFGCNNGLILAGARVYWAMAKDGLFFRATGRLNRHHVPAVGLVLQCVWASLLVLPRTRLRDVGGQLVRDAAGAPQYGNVYSNLLDYVVFAVLLFYILTIAAVFVLRRTRPDAPRPYRAFGYPVVPALYIAAAAVISAVLIVYKTQTTWPGLAIVLTGIPVYFAWCASGRRRASG
ncbi:MAG TPA: amino acid permease [Thermoanaerobaculaceae bacterium]|nr:amino acid permease [Thermoanaerobaculaceae bacterium]